MFGPLAVDHTPPQELGLPLNRPLRVDGTPLQRLHSCRDPRPDSVPTRQAEEAAEKVAGQVGRLTLRGRKSLIRLVG